MVGPALLLVSCVVEADPHDADLQVPWLVSQCVGGRSDPHPSIPGVAAYGITFAEGCVPEVLWVAPVNDHVGNWLLGDTLQYERRFDGQIPPGGPGFGIEPLEGGWYARLTDDY